MDTKVLKKRISDFLSEYKDFETSFIIHAVVLLIKDSKELKVITDKEYDIYLLKVKELDTIQLKRREDYIRIVKDIYEKI